jgi:protocatechuate 3,4-dioxygenase beta subunit
MRRELAALAVVLAFFDAAAAQQPRPRDPRTAGQPAQPAAITGRVTAAESGVPLRNAIVSATSGMGFPREVVTDERGRFELRGLEPGAWQITVSRAGYISRKFGQSRPFGREQPIPLTAGQQVGV